MDTSSYWQLGISLVAATAIFMVLITVRYKRSSRSAKYAISEIVEPMLVDSSLNQPLLTIDDQPVLSSAAISNELADNVDDNLLVMSVMAQPEARFAAYDLLQAILATGLQFGDMNIFHYYSNDKECYPLFSLASATKPGNFDMDRMGDFSCIGLTLFADLSNVKDPQKVFHLMLKTAEQLCEDLDGMLFAGQRTPWDETTQQKIQQQVLRYL